MAYRGEHIQQKWGEEGPGGDVEIIEFCGYLGVLEWDPMNRNIEFLEQILQSFVPGQIIQIGDYHNLLIAIFFTKIPSRVLDRCHQPACYSRHVPMH